MKSKMTSKERIIHTIEWKETDYLPLTFNGISHTFVVDLDNKLKGDPFKAADYCLALGVDTGLHFYLPELLSKKVNIHYVTHRVPGEKCAIFSKEYMTPKGKLVQSVRKNENYPFDEIALFSDHLVPPGRSYKYMVDCAEELDVLEAVFAKPEDDVLAESWAFAKDAKKFTRERAIIFAGGLAGIGDPLLWLSGVENIIFMAADDLEALHRYIEIVSNWNMHRLQILIDMGVDMIIRRGWYESTDFWSPSMFREFLLPVLKKEVNAAHNAGVKYAYIMNSGVDGLAELLVESGLDMQTNAEPEKNDIVGLRKVFHNKVAMCTGINNYHVLEEGGEKEIDEAVRFAVENYAPGGGFILCPSDAVGGFGIGTGRISEKILKNIHSLVESWKRYC